MTSDFRKPAKIKSSNGDQHRSHMMKYLKVNDFKNFLCCKTFAAKVLKYSEVTKSNQNKFTQGALDSLKFINFCVALKDLCRMYFANTPG